MAGIPNNQAVIRARRERLWSMLTKGMRISEIAQTLNVDSSTVNRDIKFMSALSNNFLNDLARRTLPQMYSISIDGIKDILKESWSIYASKDEKINWFQRLAALKLAKDCHESIFHLLSEGPSVLAMRNLEERLFLIENNNRQAS
jgi:IS30 family transposase